MISKKYVDFRNYGRKECMKQRLIDKFQEIYGEDGPVSVYFAPGRVNLIGDHTDYNLSLIHI